MSIAAKRIAALAEEYKRDSVLISENATDIPTVVGMSVFKDEEDIIYYTLEHAHVRLGINHFFLIDNNSSDKTLNEVYRFSKDYKVTIRLVVDCDVEHIQWMRMTVATRMALSEWKTTWVYPFDSDEALMIPGQRKLGDLLAERGEGVDCFSMPMYDYATTIEDNAAEPNPYHRMQYRHDYTSGRTAQFKVIFRAASMKAVTQGNHTVLLLPGHDVVVDLPDVYVRHALIRTFDQLARKVSNRAASIEASPKEMERLTQYRWAYWYQKEQEADPTALARRWEKIYITDKAMLAKMLKDPY